MRIELRVWVVVLALVVALGCGSADQPAPSSSDGPAAGAPADGPGAPAAAGAARSASGSTQGAPAGGGEGSAAAPSKEAVITTMPMDVPSGTELILTLDTPVSSETAKPDQPVRATVAKPVVVAGMIVIPEGATVTGAVVEAERSGRVKGRASIALRFNEVIVMKTPYRIVTARIARQAAATKGEDAKKIAIGAGIGTAIGAIAGGKKGAAIGAGVGGGAGTGAVLATRGEDVSIPAGATLRTKITETVRITAQM